MAGFFDKAHYPEVGPDRMDDSPGNHSLKTTPHDFLEICGNCVSNEHQDGTFAYGTVSNTGYGDEYYRCCFHRNSEGKTDIACIGYL